MVSVTSLFLSAAAVASCLAAPAPAPVDQSIEHLLKFLNCYYEDKANPNGSFPFSQVGLYAENSSVPSTQDPWFTINGWSNFASPFRATLTDNRVVYTLFDANAVKVPAGTKVGEARVFEGQSTAIYNCVREDNHLIFEYGYPSGKRLTWRGPLILFF
ncbi:hypothetical protein HDU97_005351 [Phlyctochytrium planicorne]|nr:hypothetical protein HDU97_005351 [Phlyctochytrium planicorne]